MPEQDRTLFVLCGGMGGHAMGDLASHTVCDVFANYWQEKPEFKDCEKKVHEACHKASVAITVRAVIWGMLRWAPLWLWQVSRETKLL